MSAASRTLTFRIHGMDCVEEVATLKRDLSPLVDESQLQFDILNHRLTIDTPNQSLTSQHIIDIIARTGMRAEVWRDATPQSEVTFWKRNGRALLTVGSGVFGLIAFLSHIVIVEGVAAALGSEGMGISGGVPLVSIIFYLISILCGAWFVVPKAWRAVSRLRTDMNLLMMVAVAGAAAIGEWFEAATVAFLFSISLLLESWSVGRARRAIAALMDLSPPTARVRDENGQEKEMALSTVSVGTKFIVRPGEKIALDGRVLQGISSVNQAPITGESVPVQKQKDAEVFAGTINGDGVLIVKSTKPVEDTTLARIIKMIGEAQSKRSPSEKWIEKFARYYTPIVMAISALVLLIPPLLFRGDWLVWLYRSLVLLVIACPCALVISTPVSIVAALAAAAKNGVLVKGGIFIEAPAHLRAIAVDKTGTLTYGNPQVVGVTPLNGHTDTELLQRAAALESHSNHPLARAIVTEASERNVTVSRADSFEIIPGKGAHGIVNGKPFWLGSHRYLEQRGQETPEIHEQLEALQEAGCSIVVVGNENHVCGFISLADSLRPTVKQTLSQLHALGIENIVMLTGDNQGTANAIALEAGIDKVHAELLPDDKVDAIEDLVSRYDRVAMIGDGVNDAPALACASLGIAMGAVGTDAAIETADIALMSDELAKLPWLIEHSRRTLAIIRQNITFSLTVKGVFVALTFAGFASLWAAIAADMGASLLVVFNGLRLIRIR